MKLQDTVLTMLAVNVDSSDPIEFNFPVHLMINYWVL